MTDVETVTFAFGVDNVTRLTGLTKAQLQYWDKLGFFPPQYASENRRAPHSRVYSFRDVVGLRTLSLLRNWHKISLQRVRAFAERLSNYETAFWSSSRIYVRGNEIHVGRDDSGFAEDKDGQFVPIMFLNSVIGEIARGMDDLRRRKPEQRGKIAKHRFVARNAPTIEGTRIPVATIKRYDKAGYSVAEILAEYPSLTEADIDAALAYQEEPAGQVA